MLGSSFVVQLFTLANPLLIQVIIDKVISQRSLETLQVLGIALVAVTIFEGLLGSLLFMFADTTNKSTRLGAEVIDHLLIAGGATSTAGPWANSAPGSPNSKRSAISSPVKHSRRSSMPSVIYILVMALYSWVLT